MSEGDPTGAAPPAFHERLRVPLMWWVVPVFFVVTFAVGLQLYLGTGAAVTGATVSVAAVAAGLLRYGSVNLEVTADRFRAGRAWLPLPFVGAVYPLDAGQARALRGPRADARAHLVLRGYVPAAVRVDVSDPADPTPYWYVSTRRPHELAAALAAARDGAARPPAR